MPSSKRSQGGSQSVTRKPFLENTDNALKGDDILQRALDIWEALRDEHHEAIEQLPLSLHRQFALMRELEEQTCQYNDQLLLSLAKYISLRQPSLFLPHFVSPSDTCSNVGIDIGLAENDSNQLSLHLSTPQTGIPSNNLDPESSRGILTHAAWLSEEIMHASEEKVNIAQASYDTVDRHIRLLNQVIKEQESSVVLGIRAGTQSTPIILPDIVVPRWARPTAINLSPLSCDDNESTQAMPDADPRPTTGIVSPDASTIAQSQRKKGKRSSGKSLERSRKLQEISEIPRRASRSLKSTVSTQYTMATMPPDLVIDPNEPLYCYCNRVSFGEMIGCDNRRCKREWFHLACAGFTEAPKGTRKWYCRECSVLLNA